MPSLVSSEFFINLMLGFVFEVSVQKFLDERVVEPFHLVGRADGQDASVVDDRDAVGDAERQVAVMRHDQRRDVDALA